MESGQGGSLYTCSDGYIPVAKIITATGRTQRLEGSSGAIEEPVSIEGGHCHRADWADSRGNETVENEQGIHGSVYTCLTDTKPPLVTVVKDGSVEVLLEDRTRFARPYGLVCEEYTAITFGSVGRSDINGHSFENLLYDSDMKPVRSFTSYADIPYDSCEEISEFIATGRDLRTEENQVTSVAISGFIRELEAGHCFRARWFDSRGNETVESGQGIHGYVYSCFTDTKSVVTVVKDRSVEVLFEDGIGFARPYGLVCKEYTAIALGSFASGFDFPGNESHKFENLLYDSEMKPVRSFTSRGKLPYDSCSEISEFVKNG
ncbi:MAG: hypothetical protein GDA35_09980 [Hyphomonadaceae bacterium]|nr:hypothetical protein [Hyphomonadaceae bacterium]